MNPTRTHLWSFAIVAALSGCAPITILRPPTTTATTIADGDEVEALVVSVATRDAHAKRSADALARRGAEVVPELHRLLVHAREESRFAIVQLLGRIADPRSVSVLVDTIVGDDSRHVRYRTLAILRGGFASRDEYVDEVMSRLRDHRAHAAASEQWNATFALASLGDESMLPAIRVALADDDGWQSMEAVWAAQTIHDELLAVDLAPQLESRRGSQLWSVIATLAAIPGPAATAALQRALELPDETAVQRAERALRSRPKATVSTATRLPSPSRDRLPITRGDDVLAIGERWQLATAAGTDRTLDEVERLATLALSAGDGDRERSVFWRAVWAMRRLGVDAAPAIQRLTEALRGDDPGTRLRAAVALAYQSKEPDGCGEVLLTCLTQCDEPSRALALTSLTSLGHAHALVTALDWLQDDAEVLRRAAIEALARWPKEDERIAEGLGYALLRDPRPALRMRAAAWLGRRGGSAARLLLQTALRFEADVEVSKRLEQALAALPAPETG